MKLINSIVVIFLFLTSSNINAQNNNFSVQKKQFDNFYSNGDYDSALIIAQNLLNNFKSDGDTSYHFALSLKFVGICFNKKNEVDSAGYYFRKSVDLFEYQKQDTSFEYIKLLNSFALFNKEHGNLKATEHFFDRALILHELNNFRDQKEYARFLNNYGNYFLELGLLKKADSLFKEAEQTYIKLYQNDKSKYTSLLHSIAKLEFHNGNYKEADKLFKEWNSIIDTMPQKTEVKINGILEDVEMKIKLDDYKNAKEKIEKTKVTISSLPQGKTKNELNFKYFSLLGYYYYKIDSIKLSKINYLEASKFCGRDSINKKLTEIFEGITDVYLKDENYDSAYYYAIKSLNIKKELYGENNLDYATSLNQLSKVYKARGEYDTALELRHKVLEIRRTFLSNKHPDYASSLNNLGSLYKVIGNYELAKKYYLEALELRKLIYTNNHSYVASSLHNLGELYYEEGDYKQSISYFENCLKIKKQLGTDQKIGNSNTLNSLSNVYIQIGLYQQAEKKLIEARRIYLDQKKTDLIGYAKTCQLYGLLYYKQEKFKLAHEEYSKCLEIYKKNNTIKPESKLYAEIYHYIGRTYLKEKDLIKAEKYFNLCLQIKLKLYGKTEKHPEIAMVYKNFGDLYSAKKNYDEALINYRKAYEISKNSLGAKHRETIKREFEIAKLFEEKGEFDAAFPLYKKVFDLKTEEITLNFEWLTDEQKEAYWNLEATFYNDLFVFGSNFHNQNKQVIKLMYDATLILKGRLLETKISSENYYREIDELREELGLKRRLLAKLDSDGFNSNDSLQNLNYNKLDLEIDSLDNLLIKSWPEYDQQKKNLTVTWEKVKSQIELGEAVIEFIRYEKNSEYQYGAVVLTNNDSIPQFFYLCKENDLKEIQPQSGFSAYYPLVWQPLETALKGIKTIYYAPTGELYNVPFHALYSTNSSTSSYAISDNTNRGVGVDELEEVVEDANYLLDQYSLHQLTSTRYLALGLKSKVEKPLSPTIGLIGGLNYDYIPNQSTTIPKERNINSIQNRSSSLVGNKLDYLQGTQDEIKTISEILAPSSWKIELFEGNEGKEENIMRLEGKYAKNILHIASHGFAFTERNVLENDSSDNYIRYSYRYSSNPMVRSGIILTGANWAWMGSDTLSKLGSEQNGILTALEVSQLNLKKTRLVVLSACQTGLGKIEDSEGTFGLKRGFKLAGVEQMIVSLWSVPDKETKDLMTYFYKDLVQTLNPVISFENAQRLMRKEYPNEPSKWAGFVLVR